MANKGSEESVEEDWAVLRQFLPSGWEQAARDTGAIRRARGVDGAESLLRILLIHLSAGCSLAETAVRAREAGLGRISAVALYKRLQASEEWLRWLAVEERRLLSGTEVAGSRRLRAVDATVVSEPGSTGTDWRLHYAINLTDLRCDFFEITGAEGGETIKRVPVEAGDVILGDRLYANPAGVAHVASQGGDVLFRLNVGTLPLYREDGRVINPVTAAAKLKVGEVCDLPAWVVPKAGDAVPGRLIAIRRSAAAGRHALAKAEREAKRKGKTLSPLSRRAAQYFMVWTTLAEDTDARTALEYYRCRWQIELAFKRMKSILGLGHLPKKDPASARAWLHGKLLTSLLVERVIQAANATSPWGY
jgi:hypothetical protein